MGETMTLIFLFGAFEKHPKIAKKYDPGILVFGTTLRVFQKELLKPELVMVSRIAK